MGAGFSRASSTSAHTPGIGAPMPTTCPADSGALQVAQMVVSVGP